MKKKLSVSKLKKKLDATFSTYIRLKSSKKGYARCYTCSARKKWQKLQCGHFVSRGYLATRFDERNVRVQCVGCNVFGGGKTPQFAAKLERETSGIVATLYSLALTEVTIDYPTQIEEYEKKIEELQKVIR